ncbi:MAG TPA: hypothetical protein V6D11_04495 [Waterburya sp.]|jgi:hypothetical protein
MSSGKTAAAQVIIHRLKQMGLKLIEFMIYTVMISLMLNDYSFTNIDSYF